MTVTGSCLCGAVRLRIDGPMRPVSFCHCTQCRRQSGHFVAATAAADADMTIEGDESISWYAASDAARRGFCSTCGSLLLWKSKGSDRTSIMMGCLDKPTGVTGRKHIFCAEKGDYYEIDDGLPQYAAYE